MSCPEENAAAFVRSLVPASTLSAGDGQGEHHQQPKALVDFHTDKSKVLIYQFLCWLDNRSDEVKLMDIPKQLPIAAKHLGTAVEEITRLINHVSENHLEPDHQLRAMEEERRCTLANNAANMLDLSRINLAPHTNDDLEEVGRGAIFLHAVWQNSERILQGKTSAFLVTRVLSQGLEFGRSYEEERFVAALCLRAYCVISDSTITANKAIVDLWPQFGRAMAIARDGWTHVPVWRQLISGVCYCCTTLNARY